MPQPNRSSVERRATTARLSLLSGVGLAAVLASLLMAAAAQAQPPKPVLTGTNPTSSAAVPATSTTPNIVGKGEEGGTTTVVIVPFLRASAVGTSALGPSEYEIRIFEGAGCGGEAVATGTVAELEEPGIEVTVPEGVATTFSALEVNSEDPEPESACSNTLTYWEGTPPVEEEAPPEAPVGEESASPPPSGSTPSAGAPSAGVSPAVPAGPPSPPHLRTIPGGWANDNTPVVTGSAPGAAAVKVFTAAGCAGAPVAVGSAAQFAAGIPVQIVNNVVVSFYGLSVGPTGLQSRCSDPAYFGEDSRRPHVRITMGPASKTRHRKVALRFIDTTGNTPGTVFRCKVNRQKWRKCHSPLRLKHLKRHRRYVVKVKARDPAGNSSRKPARRRFKVI